MKRSMHTVAVLLLTLLACNACGKRDNPAAATLGPPLVTVAAPRTAMVNDTIELDGVVTPSASVNLVARVAGFLQDTPFVEGEQVRKGQLLFAIEPDSYREQVRLNQARLDQARADAERQANLLKQSATSQASVENARSQMQQAEANLRLSQINLGYCEVRAPFDGVISKRLVDVGNYVGATPGGTVLGTLLRLRPAYINFTISERDLLRVRERMPAARKNPKAGMGKLTVRATLQGEQKTSAEGVLDFIDNSLAAGTGTMQMRARFANEDLHLIPGLYAKASLDAGPMRKALLVPNAVVQSDQQGSYVFIVDAQARAARRNITVGELFGTDREVSAGLQAEDRVVIDGLGNIINGQKVILKVSEAAARAAAAASALEANAAAAPPPVPAAQIARVKRRST